MELEGNLGEFSIYAVLQFLSQGKLSGELRLEDSGKNAKLTLRTGMIVNASGSSQPKMLVNLLAYEGGIRASQIRKLQLDLNGAPFEKMGIVLQDAGLLEAEKWKMLGSRYLQEHLSDLPLWITGRFQFEKQAPQEDSLILTEVDIEPLLLSFQQQENDSQSLLASFPNKTAKYRALPLRRGDRGQIHLTRDEWKILSLIGRDCSFDQILQRSPLGQLSTWRILSSLLKGGLVGLLDEQMEAKPAGELILKGMAVADHNGDFGQMMGSSGRIDEHEETKTSRHGFFKMFARKSK